MNPSLSFSIFSILLPCRGLVMLMLGTQEQGNELQSFLFWVQGLRAFLPHIELIKNRKAGETYDDYVSDRKTSMTDVVNVCVLIMFCYMIFVRLVLGILKFECCDRGRWEEHYG